MSSISLPILIGAAIIDSINPCAFGVLIFLLAYLLETTKKPIKMLIHGLVYISAVFVTYLSAGLVLLPIIDTLGNLSTTFYVILGLVVVFAGLLEIKDFFFYGRGPSLTIIPGGAKRIEMYTKKVSGSIFSAFFLGVFVALVELPCTGAVYLAILSLMTLSGVSVGNVTLLVVYNLIFVLPLVVILLSMYFGVSAASFEHWRKEHRGLMRLMIGLVLLTMGLWMIFYRVG